MLHAANNLVSLGRSRGLRVILITQRPAKLHKDSLTQCETLVAMRLIAPQDRAAVADWIADNADAAKGKEIITSLATLKTGEAWIWSPGVNVLERVRFPRIRTFDSSSAPDGAAQDIELKPIDRDLVAAQLEKAGAQVKANDPKELRAEIVRLKRQYDELHDQRHAEARAGDAARAELQAAERHGYERGFGDGQDCGDSELSGVLRRMAQTLLQEADRKRNKVPAPSVTIHASQPLKSATATAAALGEVARQAAVAVARRPASGGNGLSKAERLVLTALAQYPNGRTKTQIAILTGYASTGGGFNNALSSLRSKSWIADYGGLTLITPAGEKALGPYDPLPHGAALLQHWLRQLSKAERAALEQLVAFYPRGLSKEHLAQACGYEPNGGGFNNALARLRTLELISGRGELRASEDLFG